MLFFSNFSSNRSPSWGPPHFPKVSRMERISWFYSATVPGISPFRAWAKLRRCMAQDPKLRRFVTWWGMMISRIFGDGFSYLGGGFIFYFHP